MQIGGREERERIPELDGIRAIAILLVIGCHYGKLATLAGGILAYGWVGVDIFFGLSGFLITRVLLALKETPRPLAVFYTRRAFRIFPPYTIAVTAITLACVAVGETRAISGQYLTKNLLFLQSFGWLPYIIGRLAHPLLTLPAAASAALATVGIAPRMLAALGVLWSISIEEYFYLLWAPVVLFRGRRHVWITAILICAAALAMRWIGFMGVPTYFTIFHRFDALVYGAMAALLLNNASELSGKKALNSLRLFTALAVTSIVVLIAVIVVMAPGPNTELRGSHLFAVAGLTAIGIGTAFFVAIVTLKSGHSLLAPLRLRPMLWLGKVSYMVYLLHAFVYLLVTRSLGITWTSTVLSVALTLLLAGLSWRFVERPLFRRRERFVQRLLEQQKGTETLPVPVPHTKPHAQPHAQEFA